MHGDRKSPLLRRQVQRGYALASIEYRLSGQALFPAQIIDCKDALAFLKQHAGEYGYDASRVAVGGDSAGGHLATLMGTTIGHADWEQPGTDYSVQAVVDYYGPTALCRDWPNAGRTDSPESLLLGAHTQTRRGRALAAAASPLTYVDGSEPPFLILHGDRDNTVPYAQSQYLRNALEEARVPVSMLRVLGGGHGFESPVADAAVDNFLDFYLKKQ